MMSAASKHKSHTRADLAMNLFLYIDPVVPSLTSKPHGHTVRSLSYLNWACTRILNAGVGVDRITIIHTLEAEHQQLLSVIDLADVEVVYHEATNRLEAMAMQAQVCTVSVIGIVDLEGLLLPPSTWEKLQTAYLTNAETNIVHLQTSMSTRVAVLDKELLLDIAELSRITGYSDPIEGINGIERWQGEGKAELPFTVVSVYFNLSRAFSWPSDTVPRTVSFWNPEEARIVCSTIAAAHDFSLQDEEQGHLLRAIRERLIEERRKERRLQMPPSSRRPGKRVLLVSGASAFSGAEMSLCQLGAGLVQLGWKVAALIALEGHFTNTLRSLNIEVICPDMDVSRPDTLMFGYVSRVIAINNPDIIHCNGYEAEAIRFAMRASGRPIVQHVRVEDLDHMSDSIESADALIAVSSFVKGLLAPYDIWQDLISIVPDEIDTEYFMPKAIDESEKHAGATSGEPSTVLTVSRVVRRKRLDVLLRAIPIVRLSVPRLKVVIVTGGFYDRQLLRELRELANELKVAEFICWKVFEGDIRRLYAGADCFVLCAENEALGRSVGEAMAMQVPVVVADSGGTPEFLRDGGGGTFTPGSSSELSERIVELLVNREEAQNIGREGRLSIVRNCHSSTAARAVEATYKKLLDHETHR